ncbi:MFS transporter [Streptomyces sp. NPDC102340]|uniref:MFS transporter n=1 Tax=unclassified Streptomyces TaxID=2593676 RepID=UPI0037FBC2A6
MSEQFQVRPEQPEATAATDEAAPPGISPRRSTGYYLFLVAMLTLITELAAFEFIVVSPGIPEMTAEFHTPYVNWVFATPLLVAAAVVPLLGKLADIIGKKRVLMGVVAVFIVGSLICATTSHFPVLLVGRGLQACSIGAAVIVYGLVRDLLPRHLVPLAVGGIGVGTGFGAIVGPVIGGYLLDAHGFRSTFWFLIVYAAVVGSVILAFVPESDVRTPQRFDFVSALLLGTGAGLIALSFQGGRFMFLGIVGVIAFAAFFATISRRKHPLIPLQLLRQPPVFSTLTVAALLAFTYGGLNGVLIPQMLRSPALPGSADPGLGLTGTQLALYWGLPYGVMSMAGGFGAGWLSRRKGPRSAVLGAGLLGCAATAMIATHLVGTPTMVALAGVVMGLGQGSAAAGSANLLIEAVSPDVQGVAAGFSYTVQGIFAGIATTAVGAVPGRFVEKVITGENTVVFQQLGYRVAYGICAGVFLLAVCAAWLMRHGREPATGGTSPEPASQERPRGPRDSTKRTHSPSPTKGSYQS